MKNTKNTKNRVIAITLPLSHRNYLEVLGIFGGPAEPEGFSITNQAIAMITTLRYNISTVTPLRQYSDLEIHLTERLGQKDVRHFGI